MSLADVSFVSRPAAALAGRTALVTGASSGIGQALALALAGAGVHVCLLGRDARRLAATAAYARRAGVEAVAVPLELTDDAAVQALAAHLPPAFAQLDFLVHAAGVVRHGLLATQPLAELDEQYRLNVRAPYLLTQVLLPRLTATGTVVFINSMAAVISRAKNGQYAASKAALKALADSLREELRPSGTRVLSVYPGKVATPLTAQLCTEDHRAYDPDLYIQPADLAELVLSALRLPATALLHDLPLRSVPPAPTDAFSPRPGFAAAAHSSLQPAFSL